MSDIHNDLFNDEPDSAEETTSFDKEETVTEEKPEAKVEGDEEGSEETGAKDNDEEPPASNEEGSDEVQTEKMIPEHRLKAAIKDVNDKLEKAQAELAELKAQPVPDREKDPDGYDLHNRIEISKQIMRDTHDDYDEKIAHYQAMVKDAPHLNNAVAAAKNPAKMAYDLAAKDMEIRELQELKASPDFKAFKEWQKTQKAEEAKKVVEKKPVKSTAKVPPNLNRATDVSRAKPQSSQDDELFKGAL